MEKSDMLYLNDGKQIFRMQSDTKTSINSKKEKEKKNDTLYFYLILDQSCRSVE